MLISEAKLEIFAECWQFCIQDKKSKEYGGEWTKEASDRLLALTAGTISVGTVSHRLVPVTIRLCDSEPALATEGPYAQINECDLKTPSGKIVVYGIGDNPKDVRKINVVGEMYRVRIYYGNAYTILKYPHERDDFYEIALWPTSGRTAVRVVTSRHKTIANIGGYQKHRLISLGDQYDLS